MNAAAPTPHTPRRRALAQWADDRLGLFTAWDRRLNRVVPGGPNWRYVLPSLLVFSFVLEAITGFIMWMFYSSNAQSAWESVFWFQELVHGGWLVRGIHYYTGHTMVVVASLYVAQLILTRLYRPPREFIFWAGLLMLFMLLALLLTGDLLRWDQEGYWSTKVRVGFLTMLPQIGGDGFKLAAGGGEFGHLTVSRFLALHVGLFSLLFALLLVWHGWLVRRQALPGPRGTTGMGRAHWPSQSLLNFLGCGLVLAAVGLLVVQGQFQGSHAGQLRGRYLGAPLGAPADMAENYEAARPEWAFRALYYGAHLFSDTFGSGSIPHTGVSWGIVPIFVIPPLLVLLFFLMPLIGRLGIVGHLWNVLVLLAFVGGSLYLGGLSMYKDQHDPQQQAALRAGEEEALRVKELALAPQGIPPAGALALLRNDAKTQGPRLFKQNCASCHNWLAGPDGPGIASTSTSAPNLYGFATRGWLAGFLDPDRISQPSYFGKTAFKGGEMVGFVKDSLKDAGKDEDEKKQLQAVVASLSAEAGLKAQGAREARDADVIKEGRKHMLETYSCTDCHRVGTKGELGKGPELNGYGSRAWLVGIVSNPTHQRFYGKHNDRMPAYEETMSTRQIELIADWLRGEWYVPNETAESQ